jgi:hypothetical protein
VKHIRPVPTGEAAPKINEQWPESHMYVMFRLLGAIDAFKGVLTRSEALQLELDLLANELLNKPLLLKPQGWGRK